MNPGDPIHLAFIAEGGYLAHAAAMFDSLLRHHATGGLVLHRLYHPALPEPDWTVLERWLAARGVRVEQHAIADSQLEGFPALHLHRSTWYRALLPELVPGLPKILYLDTDTLVLDDLRPLWSTDVSAHLFAAVTNPLYPFMENWPVTRLGLPDGTRYLNSGVLLMNLEALRRENAVAALRDYASQHPENRFNEQDALAALFHTRCLFLPPRWNAQTTVFELPVEALPFAAADVGGAREHPAIVHFIGPFKPDHYLSRHPCTELYRRHRANTPWPLADVAGRTPVNLALRRLPMAWQYRYFVGRARLRDWWARARGG
jgi:lipopolysaccharide biosynthesis glycosyltransferase